MKIARLLVALVFSIFMTIPSIAADSGYAVSSKAGPSPGSLISMDFQDANLKTVLKIFSQQSGLNFVASQNVQDRTVTIYFDGVSVEDALNHIINANNLIYEQKTGSNIFIVKESGAPAVETLTKIYELKYAQLTPSPTEEGEEKVEAEIVSVMQDILSENGKVTADKRSNSLIITDVPSQFVIIEDVIAGLDVQTSQVMIEVEMIETTTVVADRLGVDWSGTFGVYSGPTHNTVWPMRGKFSKSPDAGMTMGEGISSPGSVGLGSMTATLKAILDDTDTRVLARPKVLTLNNETAEININSNDVIETKTTYELVGEQYLPRVQVERASEEERPGISLKVTPTISKNGFITMLIEPKLITKTESVFSTTDDLVYDLKFRTAKLTVMVSDGETVIIGGLISRDNEKSVKKVPFLGDIPLLGLAFRYKTTDETDKELLIFITPHIIKEATYALANISEREQERPKAVREREIRTVLDLLGEAVRDDVN